MSLVEQNNKPLETPSSVVRGLVPGEEAPELVLPDLMGEMFDLRKLRGKKVFINFFQSGLWIL
ncbi:hypothetical protein ABE288_05575 [Bacillus salipaludis]|uniref:hypothetical protein n=1 Tax=Bacillus salipaludis TaxID=2547811 RepID=UPI003D24DBEE